jgi:PAS domain S-box-containing protein
MTPGGFVFLGAVALGIAALVALGFAWGRAGRTHRAARAGPAETVTPWQRELIGKHHVLNQLLHSAQQGYWFIDERDISTDVNAAMCALLGRPCEEIVGRPVFDFFNDADLDTMRREIASRRQDQAGGYEIAFTRPDGERVHCHVSATPIHDEQGRHVGSAGLWIDLSARRKAEQAVRESEAELRSLLDAFPGFIAAIDRDYRYTYVNERLASLFGRPAQDLIGRSMRDVLGEARFRLNEVDILRAKAGHRAVGERVYPATATRPRIDLDVAHVAGPMSAEGRQTIYVFGIDITTAKRAEEALIAARDEAERANRAKSQFLSQMSHELRTPMNAILGFAQLLDVDPRPKLAEQQQGFVREILRGARHLLSLINEVLDLGRVEAGQLAVERAPVPVQDLVEECLALMRPLAVAHGVRLLPPAGLACGCMVSADRTRLKQVLLNLMGNAIKYNRPAGDVEVHCSQLEDEVQLSVRDTGLGLSDSDRQRLFQPFERLRAGLTGIEGTGIGLALSRRLTEAMGGRIGVESEPGIGSTFWVRLPLATHLAAHDSSFAVLAPAAGIAEDEINAAKVLYIEDNPVNIVLMEAMLRRLPGLRFASALLPADGLQIAFREPPALILLDIQMPEMDGFEVLGQLRTRDVTRDIPVVAVSANALQSDIDAALAVGFADYLTKPLDLDRLLSTVMRVLRTSQAQLPY